MAVVKLAVPIKNKSDTSIYDIPVEGIVTLQQLLELLAGHNPVIKDTFFREGIEDSYRFAFLCIREGRIMALQDPVCNRDVIEIIPPIMGG